MAEMLEILDRRTGESRRMEWTGQILRVGKSAENDLVLERPAVSRRHCQLLRQGASFLLRDLGSRNGTFLDGERVEGDAPLAPGRPVQVADFEIRIVRPDGAQETRGGVVRQPRRTAPDTQPPGAVAAPPTSAGTVADESERQLTPVSLKKKIHAMLLERMDLKHRDMSNQSNEELRLHTEQVCGEIVRDLGSELPGWLTPAALVKEVVDEAIGLGPLEDLLADESVSEIMVCGWDKVYIERKGRLVLSDKRFTDNPQVVAVIRRILSPIGRRIDETTPMADGRLPDGSRVNAVIAPLALTGPTLTIRKFSKTPFTVEDLIGFGSLTRPIADFLALAVRHRSNILISGGTGSGKTTLLNLTSNFIPPGERIITVEDAAELQLAQDHVISLEARPPNIEGRNAVTIRDLVRNTLRMRPDRIVVGECRGGEALDMLQAMNTGHDGSLTTLHANAPRDALARLETLVLMAGMELPSRAIREQVASAIDFIVQIGRLVDGTRKVTHVTAVAGMEADIITLQDIFVFEQEGFDAEGTVQGHFRATGAVPDFVQTLRRRGVAVDLSIFQEPEG